MIEVTGFHTFGRGGKGNWMSSTGVQPIRFIYFTSKGVRPALGPSNELGIRGANLVW